tara:strand:- start:5758 stop:5925 length:168 start_codon:yes stop_codon:yes gene_type:complete
MKRDDTKDREVAKLREALEMARTALLYFQDIPEFNESDEDALEKIEQVLGYKGER